VSLSRFRPTHVTDVENDKIDLLLWHSTRLQKIVVPMEEEATMLGMTVPEMSAEALEKLGYSHLTVR
jgi:hypothetical protein